MLPSFENHTILTVDDSPFTRVLVRSLLTKSGAKVDEAATGEDAIRRAKEKDYTLILLDLMLPDIDGIQVLEQIRAFNDECVIALLTGTSDVRMAMTAVQHGADGYIEKQDLSRGDDFAQFFYSITQATKHRAGLTAQKRLRQVQSDFYSMVAHDMRSPLTAMLMAAETLEDALVSDTNRDHLELLGVIRHGCAKLQQLTHDYLDLSKIEAGYLQLNLHPTDVRELVEDSARLARLQAQAKQQHLVLDLPPTPLLAQVDRDKLQQAFDNLISNAIKYTPPQGTITIQLSAENQRVLFQVRDTGSGILPEHLPALFTKYHRVPNDVTRGVDGTGLGLLIVKEIITAHHGFVTAESTGQPGAGATFTVSLPQ